MDGRAGTSGRFQPCRGALVKRQNGARGASTVSVHADTGDHPVREPAPIATPSTADRRATTGERASGSRRRLPVQDGDVKRLKDDAAHRRCPSFPGFFCPPPGLDHSLAGREWAESRRDYRRPAAVEFLPCRPRRGGQPTERTFLADSLLRYGCFYPAPAKAPAVRASPLAVSPARAPGDGCGAKTCSARHAAGSR